MKKLFYLFCCMFAVVFAACEGTEPPTSNKVETGASENITQTSATLKGVVNVDIATYNSIEFGIMYDLSLEEVNNRSAKMIKASVLQGKDFKVDVTGLTANAKYYYCAYLLLNGMQYEYGAVKEFTTLTSGSNPSGNSANGHEYVDLGLSVKWATCNVGANTPEEFGDYFAWGETQPKEVYNESTYKYYKHNGYNSVGYAEYKVTKYCTDSDYGTVDNKTVLDLADDAAHANWGGEWRMPTLEEQKELFDNCTWTWTTQNGVNGYLVTSKKNGNSIFLPAAGRRLYSELGYAGSYGCYWSSSLNSPYDSLNACFLFFDSNLVGWNGNFRYYGLSVRPVLP